MALSPRNCWRPWFNNFMMNASQRSPQLRLFGFRHPDGHWEPICCPAVVSHVVGLRNGSNFLPSAPCSLPEGSQVFTFGRGWSRPTKGEPAGSAGGVGRLVTCRLRCARKAGLGTSRSRMWSPSFQPPWLRGCHGCGVCGVDRARGWSSSPEILLRLILARRTVPREVLSQNRSR